MKKLLLVALVMMAGMICISCSKDDDKDTKPMNYEEMIAGKWEVSYNSNRGLATDIITFKSIGKLFEAVWSETPYNGGKTWDIATGPRPTKRTGATTTRGGACR